jgi:hypothetical protein
MGLLEVLTIITCVTSTITMIIVLFGVLPHVKNGLTILRDGILWVTMILVLCAIGWMGWQQLISNRSPTQDAARESDELTRQIAVSDSD